MKYLKLSERMAFRFRKNLSLLDCYHGTIRTGLVMDYNETPIKKKERKKERKKDFNVPELVTRLSEKVMDVRAADRS
jgi:hypothetical protein